MTDGYKQDKHYHCVHNLICDLMDDYISECDEAEDQPIPQGERDRLQDFIHYCNLIIHE